MLHLPAVITGLQRGGKKHDREICLHIFPLLCWAHLNYNVLQAGVGNFVPWIMNPPWSPRYLYFSLVSTENNVFNIQVTTLERISKPRSPRALYTLTALLPALSLASKCSKLFLYLKYVHLSHGPAVPYKCYREVGSYFWIWASPAGHRASKLLRLQENTQIFKNGNTGNKEAQGLVPSQERLSGVNIIWLAQAGSP